MINIRAAKGNNTSCKMLKFSNVPTNITVVFGEVQKPFYIYDSGKRMGSEGTDE
jgi:hypothetical protein